MYLVNVVYDELDRASGTIVSNDGYDVADFFEIGNGGGYDITFFDNRSENNFYFEMETQGFRDPVRFLDWMLDA